MKKNTIIFILSICSALSISSCVEKFAIGDAFLEKAPGVDVNIDTVFTRAEYTRNFLWSAYGQIYCTYTKGNMMNGAPIDVLSDSYHCYCDWGGPIQTYYPGSLTEDSQDNPNGNFQGRFGFSTTNDDLNDEVNGGTGRVSIYETVRKCWQIIENIDRVKDMSDDEKSRLRGEAYTIMASRYFDAFRNFGGLCLAKKAYEVGEPFEGGRATAMQTVEFIDSLIVCAINEPGFIWNIPNADIGQWSGRLTRASARALRAKLWMHAASPLFNSAAPYMEYDPLKVTEYTNIEHVWFGKEDRSLWDKCLQYCNEFFQDNEANGNYYQLIQPSSQDEAGYRTAYRRAYRYRNDENHHEKLFDAQPTQTLTDELRDGQIIENGWGWGWKGFSMDGLRQGGAVPTNELMECFGMQDGRVFPYSDIYGAGKNPDGIDIYADRDPRLYETMMVPRQSLPAGFDYAGVSYIDSWFTGAMYYSKDKFGDADNADAQSGYRKFKWILDYVNDKMNDEFIGVSYIRLAEVYLIRAEAKAETGDLQGALDDLHIVRSRVGLGRLETMNPSLNLTSNKDNLIDQILRERNCEIGGECGDRFYDMIRRKRQDLFTKPLHEIRIYRLDENGRRMGVNEYGGHLDEGKDVMLWDPAKPWPKFEYEKVQITVGARRWWEPGFWTNKWYLDPVSRNEVQKKYGLTQNPGW
ncbi:MAG: RagB/SusD family nutrient uptake outer membrane protein [Bacteroidales bacterium]|nr:RagB/SusD family nutrient uptake outer membrane protein [Bacteroidales bacterium]